MSEEIETNMEEKKSTYFAKVPLTSTRIKFFKTYDNMSEGEILHEILYAHQVQINKLEKIRSNTSILVWFLVAIPFIFGILFFMFF